MTTNYFHKLNIYYWIHLVREVALFHVWMAWLMNKMNRLMRFEHSIFLGLKLDFLILFWYTRQSYWSIRDANLATLVQFLASWKLQIDHSFLCFRWTREDWNRCQDFKQQHWVMLSLSLTFVVFCIQLVLSINRLVYITNYVFLQSPGIQLSLLYQSSCLYF